VNAPYRNLLTPLLEAQAASWADRNDSKVVAGFGESAEERATAFANLALIDLSPLPRVGMKGADLDDWLSAGNYQVGDTPNGAWEQADGTLIARLSADELLLLADPRQSTPAAFAAIGIESYQCYALRRRDSHCWLAVSGENAAAMLAKLCSMDFSAGAFDNHAVAQTLIATMPGIVIRHDIDEQPVFYLLGDASMARYLWDCIEDAMTEFSGRLLGVSALPDDSR